MAKKNPRLMQRLRAVRNDQTEETTETVQTGDGAATVTHSGMVLYRMYIAPGQVRMIPEQNLEAVMELGATPECPACGGTECGPEPNTCPELPAVLSTRCPVCRRRLWGEPEHQADLGESDDPTEIVLIADTEETAKARLRQRLATHMLTYHPEESRGYGLAVEAQRERLFQEA